MRVAIFDRIRRLRHPEQDAGSGASARALAPIPAHLVPEVNQRVTVSMGDHVPMPSRIEDVTHGGIILAWPSLPLEFGDNIVMTWEVDGAWFSLDTRVLSIDDSAALPTVQVAAGGRLTRYDERRTDARRSVEMPIELRIMSARALRPGNELQTNTVEVSANAVRFATSAPFSPGDVLEARIRVGVSTTDVVTARVRVIRVDAVSGSWRSTCTATFEEILRSDRARLVAIAESAPRIDEPMPPEQKPHASTAPTHDGVGGRDEPHDLGTLDGVVDWLKRRGN